MSVYDPTDDKYILIAMLSLGGEEAVESDNSTGTPYHDRGSLVTYDVIEQSRELELALEVEQLHEAHKGLILNRRGASNTFTHPVAQRIVFDDESIVATGLVADQPCQLTKLLNVAPGQTFFEQVPLTEPAPDPLDPDVPVVVQPGEFQVDDDEIIIHEDDIGGVGSLRYYKESTTIVYGGPNAINEYGEVEIYVEEEGTKTAPYAWYFPRVKISNGALIDLRPGGDAVEITATALIDDTKGFADYFAHWKLAA